MSAQGERELANDRKWSRRAETFDKWRHAYFRLIQNRLIRYVRPREGSRLLDLGCGTGWAIIRAAALTGANGLAVGIDISRGMIERATKNAGHVPNAAFYLAGADKLPLEGDYFDVVISTNSFHHYPDQLAALAEVHRVLKPGGRVYILDLSADDPFTRWVDRRSREREPEHARYYSAKEFAGMFAHVGLHYIRSKPIWYPLKVHMASK
jgi:ubiquinone/menaquinone biosynthesis C-methylase UbiE